MEVNKENSWWKVGVDIFGQVSTYIIVPIILALVLGKFFDNYFNTKPWIFLFLTGVGFFISLFGIVNTVKKYIAKITEENKK